MTVRRVAIVLAVAAALAVWMLSAGQAGAATGAYLRLAHLSPDTPQVDVYVASVSRPDQQVVVPGVGYGVVSDYRLIEPGDYTISMRPTGAAASTPPLLSVTLAAKQGAAYTVAGLGMFAGIGLKVIPDDLSLPPPGKTRCRVIHASAGAQQLDVGVSGGAPIATGVGFADTTSYLPAPAGKWTLQVTPKDKAPVQLAVDLPANGVYTVLVVDRGGTLAAELRTDAKAGSTGTIPVGAMDTGQGGTAPGPGGGPLAVGLLVSAALVSGFFAGSLRRRRVTR